MSQGLWMIFALLFLAPHLCSGIYSLMNFYFIYHIYIYIEKIYGRNCDFSLSISIVALRIRLTF